MKTAFFITFAMMLLCATPFQPSPAAAVEAEAVSCVATELQPCMGSIITGAPPPALCCSKLKEQQPCLCGYIKNPAFGQYVSSPNARKILAACGVPYPSC